MFFRSDLDVPTDLNYQFSRFTDTNITLVKDAEGNRFFQWVAAEKTHWSYQRIRDEFSKRAVALLDDLRSVLALTTGEIRTITIAGGNSEYVSVRLVQDRAGCEVQSLGSRTLLIDPDLVPLSGLHKIVFGHDVHIVLSAQHRKR